MGLQAFCQVFGVVLVKGCRPVGFFYRLRHHHMIEIWLVLGVGIKGYDGVRAILPEEADELLT